MTNPSHWNPYGRYLIICQTCDKPSLCDHPRQPKCKPCTAIEMKDKANDRS